MQTSALCLALLLLALLLSLRSRRASPARARQAVEEAARRLRLTRRKCLVLYRPESDEALMWWQGKIKGRMIGLLDHGMIWIGESGFEALCVLTRKAPGGPFVVESLVHREGRSLLDDPATTHLLTDLPARIMKVSVLSDAVEAELAWKGADAGEIVAAARTLAELKGRLDELDPPLVRAIMRGDEPVARAMLRCDEPLEGFTLGGLNALTAAAGAGMTTLVRSLLKAGAKTGSDRGFPLHAAAGAGHLEIVRILLDAGVPVDGRDARRCTPLIEAAAAGHEEVVSLLLSRGAAPGAVDADGHAALDYADDEGFTQVIAMLRAAASKS